MQVAIPKQQHTKSRTFPEISCFHFFRIFRTPFLLSDKRNEAAAAAAVERKNHWQLEKQHIYKTSDEMNRTYGVQTKTGQKKRIKMCMT